MSKKFLLPCACGNNLEVLSSQAGGELRCRCGAVLEVPTMRQLADLEMVSDEPRSPEWDRTQGSLFVLGILVLIVGSAVTYWLNRQLAAIAFQGDYAVADDLDRRRATLSAEESLRLWSLYRDKRGLMLAIPRLRRDLQAKQFRYRMFTIAAGAATVVIGIGLLASPLVLRARRR